MGLEQPAKRLRRKVFEGIFSDTVVDFLLYNNALTSEEKQNVIKIAKQIAWNNGHVRVYWSDFQEAIKEWRKQIT